MPRYEYVCERCGERFEVFRSYAEYDAQADVFCACGGKGRRRFEPPRILWNFPGATRYRDPRVEAGLRYEEETYGAPLTDEKAKEVLREKDLL